MNIAYRSDESFAKEMDDKDSLAKFKEQFYFPKKDGKEVLYFCGNSLGLQPKSVRKFIEQELGDWAKLGVDGHFEAKSPWMPYHEVLTEPMARIVGAKPVEVVVMNSLTVNLHLMLVSFYRPTSARYKIVIEGGAFPSDQYAVTSQLKYHGYDREDALIELKPREGEDIIRQEDIEALIEKEGESIALIMIGGVNYYTGQAFDMKRITETGHRKNIVVGFDLAHATGNIKLQLHDWNLDFAVWCSYKYLNGGPGGVGGCFVHERHSKNFELPRFAGWWGNDKKTRFQMPDEFIPMPGAEGWQLSNAPVLSMASLRASLELFDEAGMGPLTEKSLLLTGYLEYMLNDIKNGVTIITPKKSSERGAQLSIRIKNGNKGMHQKLNEKGVVCDWREPDVIRIAPVPFYNSYIDVFRFVQIFKEVAGK